MFADEVYKLSRCPVENQSISSPFSLFSSLSERYVLFMYFPQIFIIQLAPESTKAIILTWLITEY